MLSSHLTNYNENWTKISEMHERIFNKKFRYQDQSMVMHGFLVGIV